MMMDWESLCIFSTCNHQLPSESYFTNTNGAAVARQGEGEGEEGYPNKTLNRETAVALIHEDVRLI
jgi:hypothetical protein